MQNSKEVSVNYKEALSIKVGKFLLLKGFSPASDYGRELRSLELSNVIGVLYEDPDAQPQKYFFGLFTKKTRRVFIGAIWFSEASRGANKQNWVFEVYGRANVMLARQLANEMTSQFNTSINITLVREQSKEESLSSDDEGGFM